LVLVAVEPDVLKQGGYPEMACKTGVGAGIRGPPQAGGDVFVSLSDVYGALGVGARPKKNADIRPFGRSSRQAVGVLQLFSSEKLA
jgi:hypothetical protein